MTPPGFVYLVRPCVSDTRYRIGTTANWKPSLDQLSDSTAFVVLECQKVWSPDQLKRFVAGKKDAALADGSITLSDGSLATIRSAIKKAGHDFAKATGEVQPEVPETWAQKVQEKASTAEPRATASASHPGGTGSSQTPADGPHREQGSARRAATEARAKADHQQPATPPRQAPRPQQQKKAPSPPPTASDDSWLIALSLFQLAGCCLVVGMLAFAVDSLQARTTAAANTRATPSLSTEQVSAAADRLRAAKQDEEKKQAEARTERLQLEEKLAKEKEAKAKLAKEAKLQQEARMRSAAEELSQRQAWPVLKKMTKEERQAHCPRRHDWLYCLSFNGASLSELADSYVYACRSGILRRMENRASCEVTEEKLMADATAWRQVAEAEYEKCKFSESRQQQVSDTTPSTCKRP